MLGALHLELKHHAQAEAALQRYIALAQAPAPAAAASANAADDSDAGATPADQGLVQAWLMLAQSAEQRGDFAAAEAWLAAHRRPAACARSAGPARHPDGPAGPGRQRRGLAAAVPERSDADARAKLVAEAQLLREVKRWPAAYEAFGRAPAALPGRRRPALRTGDGGREARPPGRHGAPAAPGHRRSSPSTAMRTTRSAIRWPTAACACRRRAT